MRALRTAVVTLFVLLVSAGPLAELHAQTSEHDGTWRLVDGLLIAPDTTSRTQFTGVIVIHGRFFGQTWARRSASSVQQAGAPMDARSKAARYDDVIVNAGTQEFASKTFTSTYVQSKNPALVGTARTYEYHIHADTLFTSYTEPWPKDTTKTRRSDLIFVRVRAQQQASTLDGAWRHVGNTVTAPDTTFHQPGLAGLMVVDGLSYSLIYAPEPKAGVEQAGAPSGTDAKAARYDALIANAGTLTLDGNTLTQHIEEAIDPNDVGHSGVYTYRIHGDILVATGTQPWKKDSTKTVRTDLVFVRVH
jgi:hypothetical protein